jgi:predicted RNA methylase
MSKLTKKEFKEQEEIFKLLEKDSLTEDEKIHVYENINPGFIDNLQAGVYFTPFDYALDFALMSYKENSIVDCCAGIGGLSKSMLMRDSYDKNITSITCIEQNPLFVSIGKKLLPENDNSEKGTLVKWICADVFSQELWQELTLSGTQKFTTLISNPPFGKCPAKMKMNYEWIGYTQELELMVMALAVKFATHGNMILPSMSVEFRDCPVGHYYERIQRNKVDRFRKDIKEFFYQESMSIDSTVYSDWKNLSGGKISTEAVEINLDPSEYEPLDIPSREENV